MEKKIRKYTAPEGYVYCKDGRYIDTIYPTPSKYISDYELISIEERDRRIAEEGEGEQASKLDFIEALQEMGVKV